jgi:hypothetical protein
MVISKYMAAIKPIKGNILVSVNLSQKDEVDIGGNILKTGKNYNENFRERNPVVAFVEKGNKEIPTGSNIICNYSYFDLESPLFMYDNLYSIPVNEEIYAKVDSEGNLIPVCGNVLIERLMKENKFEIPYELKKEHINKGIALTGELKDKLIFFLPFSNYTIVYNWNGEERRAIKIFEKEITGYLKNN